MPFATSHALEPNYNRHEGKFWAKRKHDSAKPEAFAGDNKLEVEVRQLVSNGGDEFLS
jgi:hypothetical protein